MAKRPSHASLLCILGHCYGDCSLSACQLLVVQTALGSSYVEPGYFGSTTALGKSSPVTVTSHLPGLHRVPLNSFHAQCFFWKHMCWIKPVRQVRRNNCTDPLLLLHLCKCKPHAVLKHRSDRLMALHSCRTHLCILKLGIAANAGGAAIDTSAVTSTPLIIQYTAQDALGNVAMPVVRYVNVYNPCLPEAYCTASGGCPSQACCPLLAPVIMPGCMLPISRLWQCFVSLVVK